MVVGIFIILAGIFSIVASLFNWDWYFNNRRARFFVNIFGRQGARIFYGVLGIILMVLGVMAFLNPS